jgi:parallel beta helix pectate lyase-like protein
MKYVQLLIVLLLVSVLQLSAADYYISPNGNDSNPGTMAQPWKTVAKAVTIVTGGDNVYLRQGTYNTAVAIANIGTVGNRITFAAYPGEDATIDGSGLTLPEWSGLFDLENCRYVTIRGFRVINAGPNINNAGIQVSGCDHVIIENNYTNNTASSGILVWSSTNIEIAGNEVILACNAGATSLNECITVGETSFFTVRDNHVHAGSPVRGEGIDTKDGSSNGKVYNNHVHHVMSVGIYVEAWDKHTHDIEIYNNHVHDVAGDGFSIGSEQGGLLENINVHDNISYNNRWLGIGIHRCCIESHPLKNIRIMNNTVFNNGWQDWGGGITVDNEQATQVIIRNNIVSQNLSFQISLENTHPTVQVDHNLIHGFRSGEGEIRGMDYVEGDPLFVNQTAGDFHLRIGSPAIDAGSPILASAADYDNKPRPSGAGYDIGAFEYSTSSSLDGRAESVADMHELESYPNPLKANEEALVRFTLAKRDNIRLTVNSIDGRIIAVLAEGLFNAGKTSVLFNAVRLPAGTYFYVLRSANYSSVKKLLVTKP